MHQQAKIQTGLVAQDRIADLSLFIRFFFVYLNLKKKLVKMEIVSSAFVFAIVAGLELAASKKLVTVKMELVI